MRSLLDSMNPTRISEEVSPTILSEAGGTMYVGWACAILWCLFYHWCRKVLGICTASRDKVLIMSLQAFVARRERRNVCIVWHSRLSWNSSRFVCLYLSLWAQHGYIIWHNAVLNCLVDLAVRATVSDKLRKTGEVIFVPYTRVGRLRTASHRVTLSFTFRMEIRMRITFCKDT